MTKLLSPSASLRDLLPAAVVVGATPNSAEWRDLPPAEQALVSHAVAKRQREFASGRILARRLLREIGLEVDAIGQRQDRTPIWPTGVIGSISHCRDLCIVALARDDAGIRSIGIDVELAEPLQEELWPQIALEVERDRLAADGKDLASRMGRLFSAKEAVYKCLYPICQQVLGFHELEISFGNDYTCFQIRSLLSQRELCDAAASIEGRQLELDGRILSTAVWHQ